MKTIEIALEGDYAGWTATMHKNVSARMLVDLQGEPNVQFPAFERLVVSHNFKGLDGQPCESILDAPLNALTQAMEKWAAALAELPSA